MVGGIAKRGQFEITMVSPAFKIFQFAESQSCLPGCPTAASRDETSGERNKNNNPESVELVDEREFLHIH